MKKLVFIGLVIGLAAPAGLANFVQNGDFEGGVLGAWSQWGPINWGAGEVRVDTTSQHTGVYGVRIRTEPNGSLGMKQVVAVPVNTPLTFSAWVKTPGTVFNENWAEVMLFPFAVTNDATQIDSGAGSAPYIIWKRDTGGGTSGIPGGYLPTPNSDWEQVTGSITSLSGYVTIAFKYGQNNQTTNSNMRVDDISLVP